MAKMGVLAWMVARMSRIGIALAGFAACSSQSTNEGQGGGAGGAAGMSTGGTSTGGTSVGGTSAGGTSTGGTSTGGTSTGGTSVGGTSSGGTGAGGAGGDCGNGKLDVGELCDPNDASPSQPLLNGESCTSQGFDSGTLGCLPSCGFDKTGCAICGDGVAQTAAGEQCDDKGESATCDSDCTFATCGDGVKNVLAGEACDDAGNSASCDADCTPAKCGDKLKNPSAGEECDDGNGVDNDACSNLCKSNAYVPCPGGTCKQTNAACQVLVTGPGVSYTTCLQNCAIAANCPEPPPGGTLAPVCTDLNGSGNHCVLLCSSTSECPTGMICASYAAIPKFCTWAT